jgi:hypothetical protein
MRTSTSLHTEGNLSHDSDEMKGVMMLWHFVAIVNIPN